MAYGFPELSYGQICTSMDELFGIKIQESWFKKPEATQWLDIFRRCVCEITGVPEDTFFQQHLFASEFEYPEIHTDSVPIMHLVEALKKIMPSLDVHDFRGSDVITPTAVRLKKLCSAIINFIRFKDTRISTYEAIRSEIEQEREHHEMLLKRNEELKQRINSKRAERAQQEPEVQKVQDEIEKITLRMQEHQRNKQNSQSIINNIKTRSTEKKAERDQLKCAILKSKEDQDKLSMKIVQSPEKVRAEQDHLKDQLQHLKEDLDKRRNRLNEVQEQRRRMKQLGVDAEKGLQILQSIKGSIDKENEIETEKAHLYDKIQEYKEQGRELHTKKEQLQQMLSMKQEKLSKLSLQHQSKMRVLQEQLDVLQKEKSDYLAKQSSDTERKKELIEYKKQVDQSVTEVQLSTEKQINNMKEMYARLLENTDKMNKDFCTNWDQVRQLAKQ